MDDTSKTQIQKAHDFYSVLIANNVNTLSIILVENFKAFITLDAVNFILTKEEFIEKLKKIHLDNNVEIDHFQEPSYICEKDGVVCVKSSTLQKWKSLTLTGNSVFVNLYDFTASMTLVFDVEDVSKISHLKVECTRSHLGHEIQTTCNSNTSNLQVN